MKKLIAICLILCLCVLPLSACNTASVSVYTSNWGKSNVYEKSVYTVEISRGEESKTYENAPRLYGTGTYTSIIEGDYKTNYVLSTEFAFSGYYELSDGTKKEVNDSITTKVTFVDSTKKLTPILSERTYVGSTVEYAQDGTYSVSPLSYKQTVSYGDRSADVSLYKADKSGNFVEKYGNFDTTSTLSYKEKPFDNEQLALVLRSLIKTNGYSSSLNFFAPTFGKVSALSVSIPKSSYSAELLLSLNGSATSINCYVLTLSPTSSLGGSQVAYYFAIDDKGDVTNEVGGMMSVDRSRLIQIRQSVPYSNDTFVYTLSEYVYGK